MTDPKRPPLSKHAKPLSEAPESVKRLLRAGAIIRVRTPESPKPPRITPTTRISGGSDFDPDEDLS